VNRGSATDYTAAVATLSKLKIPVLPMVGNHDTRHLFRTHLKIPHNAMDDFVQYKVPTSDGFLICLDTLNEGHDAGAFCEKRLKWLKETLETSGDMPAVLFMHHPPHALGLPMQDSSNLLDGPALLDIATTYGSVKQFFIGHVHRPITGSVRGIPFATMRSVLYQAPAPKPDWTWDSFEPAKEAPNIGVIELTAGAVTVHFDTFCPYDVGGA